MLAFELLGYQALDMLKPAGRIADRRRWPGVAPAVAKNSAIHRRKDRLAGGVGDALQRAGALGLTVFVIANRRRHFRRPVN